MPIDTQRIPLQNRIISSLDLDPSEYRETLSAYLPRAVSSVPQEYKEFLEKQYSALKAIVASVGITPALPVELNPDLDPNEINPANLKLLLKARYIIPLTYAISDGRGWEMGFSYAIGKPIFPLVLKGQKINIPTIRLPFQVPIVFQDLTSKDGDNLRKFLEQVKQLDIYRGGCDIHGNSLKGLDSQSCTHCLRCLASEDFEVVNARFD